jgi:hypothetical protein
MHPIIRQFLALRTIVSLRPAVLFLTLLSLSTLGCRGCGWSEAGDSQDDGSGDKPAVGGANRPWIELGAVEPSVPGVISPSSELDEVLGRCLAVHGPDYEPRTVHLTTQGYPEFINRLVCESSPYLLQHAHNPVNWYPWGDDAFAQAQARGVPVLLSVGYSTCHWCHVMERESFEDLEIAEYINANFVAIKVDREERPDVDDVYMAAVQALTGRGGWPMTVVLTPDREPFFGGTYFPPRAGARGRSFLDILRELSGRYAENPQDVFAEAAALTARITSASNVRTAEGLPDASAIRSTVQRIAQTYDPIHGGFGAAPKFPRPATLEFLLHYHRRTQDPGVLQMVTETLDHMARGGIYDQVGGGFHRYSTDADWLVPHFEKMLYDNAQLSLIYLDAWQVTGDTGFARIVEETLDYVAREMTSPGGGFYSATDADSEAPSGEQEEGWFFTWSNAELVDCLGAENARTARALWGTTDAGNFEGRNILHQSTSRTVVGEELGVSDADLEKDIEEIRDQLYETRSARPSPFLDDKVLTAWNGLMISAFARAGGALGRADYVERSQEAALFVLDNLRDESGRLLRSYRGGSAQHDAILDDYAFFVAGLLDLFEADANPRWLREALTLQQALDSEFWDAENGGYFLTGVSSEVLLTRPRPDYDGALPSGNSVAAFNLLRLSEFTLDDGFRQRAQRLLVAFGETLSRRGTSAPLLMAAFDLYLDEAVEIVIVRPVSAGSDDELAEVLRNTWLPHAVAVVATPHELGQLSTLVPWTVEKVARSGDTTAYVCRRNVCELPTSEPGIFARQLRQLTEYTDSDDWPRITVPLAEPPPAPWTYDAAADQHWHPGHGHWHPGPAPPSAE